MTEVSEGAPRRRSRFALVQRLTESRTHRITRAIHSTGKSFSRLAPRHSGTAGQRGNTLAGVLVPVRPRRPLRSGRISRFARFASGVILRGRRGVRVRAKQDRAVAAVASADAGAKLAQVFVRVDNGSFDGLRGARVITTVIKCNPPTSVRAAFPYLWPRHTTIHASSNVSIRIRVRVSRLVRSAALASRLALARTS
jgi:hypothetical protein